MRGGVTFAMAAFEVVGEIDAIEVIASGRKLRQKKELHRQYGKGRWRKLRGIALVRIPGGEVRKAEVHWYEAHGIGRRRIKIKRFID